MQNCNTLPYEMSCLLFFLHRRRLCLAFFFVVIGEKIYIYIYRTFLVTLALRHVTKLNHGRRKFAAHFRIFKFHVQVMPGLSIRFSYSVFWNRKAVIRLVIFSFNLPWIDIVKKRKVICMLNYLTKCWTPFLGQRFLKLDFCISDTPHSLRALVYYLTRPKVRLFPIRSTLLLQLICQHSGSALNFCVSGARCSLKEAK